MAKSYVGIVSRCGLELFCPEVEHAAKFIRQYLQRCQRRAYGVWFFVDAMTAEWLHVLTMTGDLDAAWSSVEQLAEDGGVFSASHKLSRRSASRRNNVASLMHLSAGE